MEIQHTRQYTQRLKHDKRQADKRIAELQAKVERLIDEKGNATAHNSQLLVENKRLRSERDNLLRQREQRIYNADLQTIAGMGYPATVDRISRHITELDAENKRLRSALDDCRTAPFETVDQIREYARSVLEGGDGDE